MSEREDWIRIYNAGDGSGSDGIARPKWPEVLMDRGNMEALVEGILAERIDWPDLVFAGEPPPDEVLEAIEMMIAIPELQMRFAPEGCFLKSRAIIRLYLEDPDDAEDSFQEDLEVECEFCLSFTERYGVSPVVDIMAGKIVLRSTGAVSEIEPGTEIIDPERAVGWGMNGCGSEEE
jgi:hypothetical protein